MKNILKFIVKIVKWVLVLLVIILIFSFLYSLFLKNIKTPKKNADWEIGQEKTVSVIFDNENILVKNLRDFNWLEKEKAKKVNWKNIKFRKSDIVGLKMGVSHFSAKSGIAHVFIIFELKNRENIGLSIESRRENGERFGLLEGLTYEYENIYILATEKDLLDLRKVRDEKIYIYPINVEPKNAQKLFYQVSEKINLLKENPEFYHLFFNNCTNQIADEVEKFSNNKFPFIEKTFLPGNSAKVLFEMGLIKTDRTNFEEMQKDFLINFEK